MSFFFSFLFISKELSVASKTVAILLDENKLLPFDFSFKPIHGVFNYFIHPHVSYQVSALDVH
jgi:hypothetical protein